MKTTERPEAGTVTAPATGLVRRAGTRVIPRPLRRRLTGAVTRLTRWPPVGSVSVGDLARAEPLGGDGGSRRGTPIDRYYVDRFVAGNAAAVRGHVLEIGGDSYTRRFGGDRVARVDVLPVGQERAGATLDGDLTAPGSLPEAAFDCILAVHGLETVFDVAAAVRALHRALAPGGTLLATVPGISRFARAGPPGRGRYWSLTTYSARRLFGECFRDGDVQVAGPGNVLTAAALLCGLAAEDLTAAELEAEDRDYEVIVAVRAARAEGR